MTAEIDKAVRALSFDHLNQHICTDIAVDLQDIISRLARLGSDLHFLSECHSTWQNVEDELLAADAVLGSRDEEIMDSHYPETRKFFSMLCHTYAEAPAHLLLEQGCLEEAAQQGITLETALSNGDPGAVRRCFSRYRKALGKCFFNADDMLLKHCNQLQHTAAQLNTILDRKESVHHG